jgi:hypothetical protein
VRLTNLTTEHPTLGATATHLVGLVGRWSAEVRSAPGASAWTHHRDLAERTEQLASHLEATLVLAEEARFPSAFVVARTALEHHLLDRLLLLADRYEEILTPPDSGVLGELERTWHEKSEQWTREVVTLERTRSGRSLKLVRLGHNVRDDGGNVREQISPYWVAMEHHDAFLGHPDVQALTVSPFASLDEREDWARHNQALYGAFLRWGSICSNLELSHLASRAEIVQLQVHYAFLSAFTHATTSGYEVVRQAFPNSPPAAHLLGELALLYVATIAVVEMRSWAAYIDGRPRLLRPLDSAVTELANRAGEVTAYFWFLGGEPQPFDYCQEANRRAHPRLLTGQRWEIQPAQLAPEDVGYYAHPYGRLQRMHTGGQELTTGFGFGPSWSTLHW